MSSETPNRQVSVGLRVGYPGGKWTTWQGDPDTGAAMVTDPVRDAVLSPMSEFTSVQRTTTIALSSIYPLSQLRNEWSGDVTFTNAEYQVGPGGVLDSADIGRYVPGYAAEAGIGVRFPSVPAGMVAHWGYFDDDNGMMWRHTDAGYAVLLRRDGVDTVVPRDEWNADRVDGSGPSGFALTPTQGHIFVVRFTWYGFGQIEWGVIASDRSQRQRFVPVHRINTAPNTSVLNPNLPLRTTVTGAGQMLVRGRQFSIIGKYRPYERLTSVPQRTSVSMSTSVWTPLCSARRLNTVEARSVSLLVDSHDVILTGDGEIGLILDGDLTGPSWGAPADVPSSDTVIEVDTSASAVAVGGGQLIFSEMVAAAGAGSQRRAEPATQEPVRIPRLRTVTLVARCFAANQTARGLMRIGEEW